VTNLHPKFEVSSFNRSRDMEAVPNNYSPSHSTHSLAHICPMLLTLWVDNEQLGRIADI